MSQTIENRIVEMQFENKQFESGVQESLSTLDKLKKSLNFDDSAKNLQSFSNSVTKNLDMNGIGSAVEKLKDRFSTSGIVGMEVIKRLTNFAIDAGKAIASALDAPFAQIRQGGWKRAMNIEDAKFQLQGLGVAWENVAGDIDYAVADTAYGLDVAAKACAQLSALSVQAGDDMKAALRGISGVAAMGNTEYENISRIFTKAAGNGKVMAMELNQISQYGLNARASLRDFFNNVVEGNEKVKDIPEDLKKKILDLTGGVKVAEGDINEFVHDSEIDFKTFAYAMDNAFGEHAKKANETFFGALSNIKAALSKIGAEFATPVIKGAIPVFNEIRVFLNELRKQMGPVFTVFSNIANVISTKLTDGLHKFKLALLDFGAIEHIGNAIRNIFTSIVKLIGAVMNAFRTVFPPTHQFARSVDSIAEGIERFSEKLVISDGALLTFRNIMIAVFNILKGVGAVIKTIVPIVANVISVVLRIASVIVNLIGYLTTFIMQLDIVQEAMDSIRKAGGLFNFVIDKLRTAFANLRDILTDTSTVTGRFFMGLKDAAITAVSIIGGVLYLAFVKIKEVLSYFDTHDPLGSLITGVKTLIDKLKELPVIKNIVSGVEVAFGAIGIAISKLIGLVKDFISNLKSGMSVIKAVGVALSTVFGGAINLFGTLISKIKDTFSVFSKDRVIEESIESPIYGANTAMNGMVHTLTKTKDGVKETTGAFNKAKTSIVSFGDMVLTKIRSIKAGQVLMFAFGTAITVLALNLSKLTKEFANLTKGVTSVTRGLSNFLNNFGKKRTSFAEGLIAISIAVGALTASLYALSQISGPKLAQVTIALGSLLTIMGVFSVIGKNGAGPFAASMMAFSGGILILVGALYAIDKINMDNIWKKVGVLGAITAGMLAVAAILSKVAPSFSKGGLAIVSFAGSVYILAKALDIISHADLNNIRENWLQLSGVILAFAAFASIASNVGITAALGLIGFVGVLKLLSSNVDLIKNNFGNIQSAFRLVIEALKNAVSYLYNGLKKVAKDIEQSKMFGYVIAGSVTAIVGSLIGIILALGKAGKGLKKAATGFMLIGATIAGLMYVTTKIAEMSQKINPTQIDKATALLKSIMIFLGVLSGLSVLSDRVNRDRKTNDTMLKDVRKLLTSMSLLLISLGGFAAMVGSLSKDEFERVKTYLLETEIVVGILAMVATTITAVASRAGKSEIGFSTFAGIVLLLGSMIGSIAVLMFMFSQVDWERDKQQLLTAAAAFGGIVTAISIILGMLARLAKNSSEKGSWKAVAVLAAFGALILEVAGIVYVFTKQIPSQEELTRAGIIAGAIVAFMTTMSILVVALQGFSSKFLNTKLRQKAFNKTLVTLGLMIAAVVAFGAELYALRNVDAGRIWGQATALIFMLTSITSLTLALEKFSKDTKFSITKKSWSNIQKTFLMIGEFLVAFSVLAYAFYKLQNVDAGRMWGQVTALTTALTALSALSLGLMYFAKQIKLDWGTMAKVAAMLGGMIALFAALSAVFAYIIDGFQSTGGELIGKSQTIILALTELGTIMFLLSKFLTPDMALNGAIGEAILAGMVGLFHWLSVIFKTIDELKTEGIMAKSQTIILVMTELIALIGVMGGLMYAAGEFALGGLAELALWPMIGLFGMLTDVFLTINQVRTDGVMEKSQVIILVMTELVGLIALMGGLMYAVGEFALGGIAELALWPMIGLFKMLTEVFLTINEVHTEGVMNKSQTIILCMLELEGLIAVLGVISPLAILALAGIPGILALTYAFGKIAEALNSLGGITVDHIQGTVDAIVGALWSMVGIGTVSGLFSAVIGPGLLILSAGILALGAACNSAGTGISAFSVGITNLSVSINELTSTGPKITAWFTSIAVGVTTLSASIMASIVGLSKSVVTAINNLIVGVVAAITSGGTLIFAAAASLGVKLKEGFESKVNPKVWGAELIDNLVSGIRSKISAVSSAAASVAHAIWEYLHFTEPEKGDLVGSGQWFAHMMQNFGGSITSNMDAVIGPASEIGTKIKDTLSNIKLDGVMDVSNIIGGKEGFFSDINSMLEAVGLLKKSIWDIEKAYSHGSSVMDSYYYKARSNVTAAQNEVNRLEAGVARLQGTSRGAGATINKKLDEAKEKLKLAKDNLNAFENGADEAAEASNKFTDALGGIGEGGGKAAKGTKEAKDAIADFYNSIESAISLFDKFEEEEGMSSEELLSNMESQIFGIANWSTQLQELATKGIDQGLLKKLADMGPSGQKYVKAFVSMTADQLAHANELYQQSLLLPQHVTAQVFASFEIAGQNATTGFLNGLDHDAVKEQGIQFAHDYLDSFRAAMGIHSPSEETKQDGINTTSGLTKGITWPTAMHNLEVGITRVVNTILDTLDSGLDEEKFTNMGRNIVNGIKKGIEDQGAQGSLFDKLRQLCNRVVEEAKSPRGFWEHSPSRKFQDIGKFVVEGLAKGISDNTYSATDAIGKSATDVIDEMRDTINKANEALIDEVNDPVIKPVLDLSEIQNGSRTLNDMLSRNSAFSASSSFRSLQHQQWGSQSALLNATMDNSDVVSAIDSLKTDISSLKDAMTNIRMVLDTGTMVGAMTPMIDQELGMRQVYAGRGI